jgi:hypothetical protein
MKYFIQLFHAVLLRGYFPEQWKVAQIILISKAGKGPISILFTVTKVFEKLLLERLLPVVENNR